MDDLGLPIWTHRLLAQQPTSVACRTDEAALPDEHSQFVDQRGRTMSVFTDRALTSHQAGWPLLHRLRCLWRAPAPLAIVPPAIPVPMLTDKWPSGLRALVADDNPVNLILASEMLEYFGFQSVLAADGAQAVAIAANNRFDLILMDLQMPVLDGLGATRQIRRSEREQVRTRVPVVAFTSVSGNRCQFSGHGMDDVLEKPCELQAMRDCLLRWCPLEERLVERPEASALPRHWVR